MYKNVQRNIQQKNYKICVYKFTNEINERENTIFQANILETSSSPYQLRSLSGTQVY